MWCRPSGPSAAPGCGYDSRMSTAALPTLREIKSAFDAGSYTRGAAYADRGAVFDTRRQGATLKARCHGRQGGPYRVEVTLKGARVLRSQCSCPIGGGCKHVVALLLTWRAHPGRFIEVEDMDTAL